MNSTENLVICPLLLSFAHYAFHYVLFKYANGAVTIYYYLFKYSVPLFPLSRSPKQFSASIHYSCLCISVLLWFQDQRNPRFWSFYECNKHSDAVAESVQSSKSVWSTSYSLSITNGRHRVPYSISRSWCMWLWSFECKYSFYGRENLVSFKCGDIN